LWFGKGNIGPLKELQLATSIDPPLAQEDRVKAAFWKTNWFLGLVVTVIVFAANERGALRDLEWRVYDLGLQATTLRPANDDIVVIAIDDESLRQLGPWPWSRSTLAAGLRQLMSAKPLAVGFVPPLVDVQNGHAVAYLRQLREGLDERSKATTRAREVLRNAERGLDTEASLAASFAPLRNVALVMPYSVAETLKPGEPDGAVLDHALSAAQADTESFGFAPGPFRSASVVEATRVQAPLESVARKAAAAGVFANDDPQARLAPLVVRYADRYLPSLALLLTAYGKGVTTADIRVASGYGIRVGGELLRTDGALRAYPYFYRTRDGRPPFQVHSFHELYSRSLEPKALSEKIVLIGPTSPALVGYQQTPIGEAMAPTLSLAHTVSSLLNDDLYELPVWVAAAQTAAFLLVALYLMIILPRLGTSAGWVFTILLLIATFNAELIMLMSKELWVPLMAPCAAIVLGHIAFQLKKLGEDHNKALVSELSETNRALGQSLQEQGNLDVAFERYRRCAVTPPLLKQIYSLGLDYERKRQFNKATTAFQYIAGFEPDFEDIRQRIKSNQEMERMLVLGKPSGGNVAATLIVQNNGLQKPRLGRYEIEHELGRGAMGMVYLGRDPRIGRTVAIKTMALSQEFEAEQLEEVRERFFREAETAGRLNHPNIVTIYDVGEEQDLAYIAMDYLTGENLLAYCKTDTLLPTAKVFDIGIQVAEALDYAHKHSVVHRDIKPANLIYDTKTSLVKVTDFGVACLTDSSKTKTGTILGSPSYMSPEQLGGQKVDGRSDLFSLGIMLYQLLAGELPFVGESLASLMYKIANEKHPDVRMFRPDLPSCVSKIVNKALHKDLERRFQTGVQMAGALRRCKERLDSGK